MPRITVLLSFLSSFSPKSLVLGVNGVEFGLHLRRMSPCNSVKNLLIVRQHIFLVRVDVVESRLDLGGRKAQDKRDAAVVPADARVVPDVVNGDARAGDFRAASAVDNGRVHGLDS